jgi:hypothetical protein
VNAADADADAQGTGDRFAELIAAARRNAESDNEPGCKAYRCALTLASRTV